MTEVSRTSTLAEVDEAIVRLDVNLEVFVVVTVVEEENLAAVVE